MPLTDGRPPKLTRREVDGWLAQLQHEIASILRGPAGELRARLVLMQRRVERWRDRVGLRR
jgi:hypothetical protein